MENNERQLLRCPYCGGEFKPSDILFYTEATYDSREMRNFGWACSPNKAHEEKPKENEFPLGILTDDTVARNFLRNFQYGDVCRFTRTAKFYAIKPQNEIGDGDKGYGYVESYEDEQNTIPRVLKIKDENGSWKSINQRVCPKCHCDIPLHYFIMPKDHIHEIALAGGMSAGKTQFMIVAIRELMVMLYQLNLGCVEMTESSRLFYDEMVKYYNEHGGSFAPTILERQFPLVLEVIGRKDHKEGTHFLIFHDCAGEYAMKSAYGYLLCLDSFENAEMLLFMVDCAQFFGEDNVKHAADEFLCTIPYENAIEPLVRFRKLENIKEAIVVMTKCDGIFYGDYIHNKTDGMNDGMTMVTTNMNAHRDAVDIGIIDRVERELLDLLDYKGKKNLKETFEKKFIHKPG